MSMVIFNSYVSHYQRLISSISVDPETASAWSDTHPVPWNELTFRLSEMEQLYWLMTGAIYSWTMLNNWLWREYYIAKLFNIVQLYMVFNNCFMLNKLKGTPNKKQPSQNRQALPSSQLWNIWHMIAQDSVYNDQPVVYSPNAANNHSTNQPRSVFFRQVLH